MLTLNELWNTLPGDKSDKGSDHSYLDTYEKLFSEIRLQPIRFLEIGVAYGYSLKLWRQYFPNADIHGLDIQDLCTVDGVTLHLGNACDASFTNTLGNFDVIIDDGCHEIKQQCFTFLSMVSKLNTNGLYIIEDIQSEADLKTLLDLANFDMIDLRSVKNRYDDILLIYRK